ncbi:MAG: GTP cyclohydrolase II [Parcubacteria group bacterium GW2011_GWA2_44_12]|nr:MAG: GTP cyclohydrolase II [Parcubacteria group bacterium GW2011_GWA2_44_12]
MKNVFYTSVSEAISDFKKGKLLILTDDESRENEGDFITAGSLITPQKVNFMLTYGRGLVCAPLAPHIVDRLKLPLMIDETRNQEYTKCNFTVSLNAKDSRVSTGISANDRSVTIKKLADPKSRPENFTQPGHLFPLRAKELGVLVREGHTEATVDLARLAGLEHAGALCEILNKNGAMARQPDLKKLANQHGLKILTIARLKNYRRQTEKLVLKTAGAKLQTAFGNFTVHVYRSIFEDKEHIALVKGIILKQNRVLVRVHSACVTGDVLHSLRCDCGDQLKLALQKIEENGSGVFLYLNQEGRGIGLTNKIKAYALQDRGLDTVTANERLGFKADMRDYHIGAQILHDLGVRTMDLLTNNSSKMQGIEPYGLKISTRVPLEVKPNKVNRRYLETKKAKMGHILHEV